MFQDSGSITGSPVTKVIEIVVNEPCSWVFVIVTRTTLGFVSARKPCRQQTLSRDRHCDAARIDGYPSSPPLSVISAAVPLPQVGSNTSSPGRVVISTQRSMIRSFV